MKGETACRIPTKGYHRLGMLWILHWKIPLESPRQATGQLFWPSLAFLPFASFIPERAVSCVVHVFLCYLWREQESHSRETWKDREESGWIWRIFGKYDNWSFTLGDAIASRLCSSRVRYYDVVPLTMVLLPMLLSSLSILVRAISLILLLERNALVLMELLIVVAFLVPSLLRSIKTY